MRAKNLPSPKANTTLPPPNGRYPTLAKQICHSDEKNGRVKEKKNQINFYSKNLFVKTPQIFQLISSEKCKKQLQ